MTNQPIPDFAKVVKSEYGDGLTVWFSWKLDSGILDRPISYGISVNPRNVSRLIRAFLDGNLFPNPEVAIDVDGNSYIAGNCAVYGKRINADLTRLGY